MSAEKSIRIMVVEDHPVTREGIVAIVSSQPDMEVVAEAESGEKAVELYSHHLPDVVLMDLRMRGMDGVEATGAIRKRFPKARIIVLTTYTGDELIYRAIKAGAKSYLLKTVATKELLEAIRTVYAGFRSIAPDVAEQIRERMPHPEFTQRELEVLRLLTHGKTNQEIALALHITERTVKFHVGEIFIKLGVTDRAQAATMALRRGIIPLE